MLRFFHCYLFLRLSQFCACVFLQAAPMTPLMYAVRGGNLDVVQAILKYYSRFDQVIHCMSEVPITDSLL